MKIKSLTLAGLVCFGVVCSGEVLAAAAPASKATVTNMTPYSTVIQCSNIAAPVTIASHTQQTFPLAAEGESCNVNITNAGVNISSGAMYYQVQSVFPDKKINFTWTFGQSHIGSSLNATGAINGNTWTASQNPAIGPNPYNSDKISSNPTGDIISIVLKA